MPWYRKSSSPFEKSCVYEEYLCLVLHSDNIKNETEIGYGGIWFGGGDADWRAKYIYFMSIKHI